MTAVYHYTPNNPCYLYNASRGLLIFLHYPPVNAFWNSCLNVLSMINIFSFWWSIRSRVSLINDSASFLFLLLLFSITQFLFRFYNLKTYFWPSLFTHVFRSASGIGISTYNRDMTICLPKLGSNLFWWGEISFLLNKRKPNVEPCYTWK